MAAAIADAVAGRLKSIRANPAHAYRQLFDEVGARLRRCGCSRSRSCARAADIKQYLLDDAAFGSYVGGLWGSLKVWLQEEPAQSAVGVPAVACSRRPLAG